MDISPNQLPPMNEPLQMPPKHPRHDHRKSLMISLVVSAILLLASIALAAWLLLQPVPSQKMPVQDTGDKQNTSHVKNIQFISPASLPANYQPRQQNNDDIMRVYYTDNAAQCRLETIVAPIGTAAPKDVAAKFAAEQESLGIKTVQVAQAEKLMLNSEDSTSYNFDSLEFTQEVNIDGIAFKKQHYLISYRQFGAKIAAVAQVCKAETWLDKKSELTTFAKTFKLKLEK